MYLAVRLSALALGLAALVYGASTLTGDWLGTAPWTELTTATLGPFHLTSGPIDPDTPVIVRPFPRLMRRDYMSVVVIVVGLILASLAAWPGAPPWAYFARRPLPVRVVLVAVGLALGIYCLASLTGGWLPHTPWWDWTTRHGETLPGGNSWLEVYSAKPLAGRLWISGGLAAVGLGLAALGAWPSRRRESSLPAPATFR